ncbi:hypothetical protein, partial [Levilinea saccharolytica]
KHLFTDRGSGERLVLFEAADDHSEATYVVDLIGQNMAGDRKARSPSRSPGKVRLRWLTLSTAQSRGPHRGGIRRSGD